MDSLLFTPLRGENETLYVVVVVVVVVVVEWTLNNYYSV